MPIDKGDLMALLFTRKTGKKKQAKALEMVALFNQTTIDPKDVPDIVKSRKPDDRVLIVPKSQYDIIFDGKKPTITFN